MSGAFRTCLDCATVLVAKRCRDGTSFDMRRLFRAASVASLAVFGLLPSACSSGCDSPNEGPPSVLKLTVDRHSSERLLVGKTVVVLPPNPGRAVVDEQAGRGSPLVSVGVNSGGYSVFRASRRGSTTLRQGAAVASVDVVCHL